MTKVLQIESSSLHEGSQTREIGAYTIAHLKKKHPGLEVTNHDLIQMPVPHLSEEFVKSLRTPNAPALKLSDQLVDELLATDILLLEAPMYNFSIPSVLKAWIDHVVRAGRTFKYGESGVEALVKGKKAILIFGRGGVYTDGPMKAMDYQEPYLRAVLGFIGITDVTSIYVEGVAYGAEATTNALTQAKAAVDKI